MLKFGSVFSLLVVSAFAQIIEPDSNDNTSSNNKSAAPPSPSASLLNELKNIRNTADFLKHLKIKTKDVEKITGLNLTSSENDDDDDQLLGTSSDALSSVLAVPAGCEPRDMQVEVPRDDPMVYVWPTCTKARRCGGCCGHEMLKCVPKPGSGITQTKIKIMKASYPAMGATSFDYAGITEVDIESHTECQCQCRVLENDCNQLQEYIPSECKCKCKNDWMEKKCDRTKEWDPEKCACVCRKKYRCDVYETFDESTCRCAFKRLASGHTKDNTPENHGKPMQVDPNAACANTLRCPDGFLAVSSASGCKCQPAGLVNTATDNKANQGGSINTNDLGGDLDLGGVDLGENADLDLGDLDAGIDGELVLGGNTKSDLDLGDLDLGGISPGSSQETGGNVHNPNDRRRR